MELSKKIVLARKKKGLTQEQLADLANVTVRTVQRIESGESIPRAFTIKTLAEALGTSFEDLTQPLEPTALTEPLPATNSSHNTEQEKHFQKMLCLSCFSYLVIPVLHFLVPIFIQKKWGLQHPGIAGFSTRVIRHQVYWVIALCGSMLLTLAYNFISVVYFQKPQILHYLWTFFVLYIINAFIILKDLSSINTRNN